MDVVGSEIGQKMRSAIKAKLTELGCYVDDELPDYVMVMVANKRTRSQMEDDLQLFLGDNTESFVNWLHQVLKKLQEVTVAAPLKPVEPEKVKERSISKERKIKEKKEKSKKTDGSKKSKRKAKDKAYKKKEEKKKSKKKSKHEMIRPNIPPLLMNIEKESEPSITDVFAGQILKNHGIIMDTHKDEPKIEIEKKPIVIESKRPIIPIIDPASIPSQTSTSDSEEPNTIQSTDTVSTVINNESVTSSKSSESAITSASSEIISTSKPTDSVAEITENATREEKIKEINEIEAKIQGLKQKLENQLDSQEDSMSDDEDFLSIRTEADELINDFAEDVFQELSQPPPVVTPPLHSRKSRSPTPPPLYKKVAPKEIPEPLPQIELNLPKRPIRERLGAPLPKKDAVIEKDKGKAKEKAEKTPERLTPEKEPEIRPQKSAKSRLGSHPERRESERKKSTADETANSEEGSKRLTSKVSVLGKRPARATCASVVRVRPRPRVAAPASSLLLRAVADAHKSLLNIPPKIDPEPQKVKRALVLPMRRSVDPKKIVIEVPCNDPSNSDGISDNVSLGDLDSEAEEKSPKAPRKDKEEYTPISITKVIKNSEYVPSRTLMRRDDTLFVETINIHTTTVDKDKDTQFIVTMDGYHPNAFLAKKLMTEGLLNEDEEEKHNKPKGNDKTTTSKKGSVSSNNSKKGTKEIAKAISATETEVRPAVITSKVQASTEVPNKATNRLHKESNTPTLENRKSDDSIEGRDLEKQMTNDSDTKPGVEKRKSDIVDENLLIGKRKREISIENETIGSSKTDDSIEDPVPEKQNNDVTLDKQILHKGKSDISVDKPELEKRKSDISLESSTSENDEKTILPVKKRKASPIIFDVHKKEKVEEKVRERTISASSDSHIVLTTSSNSHKYDTVPPLSQASKVVWCRSFPQCRYGAACAFAHPRCKFDAACTRRGCVYSHAPNALSPPALASVPLLASHVVPAANYKSISAGTFTNLCKFYPGCSNPACHYYHPKPCRYGMACTNKLECNFYHHDVPTGKWKYAV